jgi:AcrR family transcriptional regulator
MATTARRRSPRPRSARGEGDRLRDEILTAAEDLLLTTGSQEAVSIRAVATAVGVTAPSIYRHFADKDELLFEVCSRHFARMGRFLAESSRAGDDPIGALATMALAYARFAVDNPEHYRIMFMGSSDHTPERYADERVLDTGGFGELVRLAQAAIATGRLRPELDDATSVAHSLWAAIHGVVSLAVAKPNLPAPALDARVDAMLDLVLHGLLAPDA